MENQPGVYQTVPIKKAKEQEWRRGKRGDFTAEVIKKEKETLPKSEVTQNLETLKPIIQNTIILQEQKKQETSKEQEETKKDSKTDTDLLQEPNVDTTAGYVHIIYKVKWRLIIN